MPSVQPIFPTNDGVSAGQMDDITEEKPQHVSGIEFEVCEHWKYRFMVGKVRINSSELMPCALTVPVDPICLITATAIDECKNNIVFSSLPVDLDLERSMNNDINGEAFLRAI